MVFQITKKNIIDILAEYSIIISESEIIQFHKIEEIFVNHIMSMKIGGRPNEMEFIGEGIIQYVTTKIIYDHFDIHSNSNINYMYKTKSGILNNQCLSEFATKIHLYRFINPRVLYMDLKRLSMNDKKVLTSVFKHFIGALNICIGESRTFIFLSEFIKQNYSFFSRKNYKYKEVLQLEFRRAYNGIDPKYVLTQVYELTHKSLYEMTVYNPMDTLIGFGQGSSVQDAENNAALSALMYIGKFSQIQRCLKIKDDDEYIIENDDSHFYQEELSARCIDADFPVSFANFLEEHAI
jgi:dsRNA-specific ribonuclease